MSKLMVHQTTIRLFYFFFRCIVDLTDFSAGDHLTKDFMRKSKTSTGWSRNLVAKRSSLADRRP
jgi:hypothetical protein